MRIEFNSSEMADVLLSLEAKIAECEQGRKDCERLELPDQAAFWTGRVDTLTRIKTRCQSEAGL